MSDLTLVEFRECLDNVVTYNWEREQEDFLDQLGEGPISCHVFLDLVVLHNAVRLMAGEPVETLAEMFPNPEGPFVKCTLCGGVDTLSGPKYICVACNGLTYDI